MKKTIRFLALILCAVQLFLLSACGGTPSVTDANTTDNATDQISTTVTDAPVTDEPAAADGAPLADGTLLYYEGFDSYDNAMGDSLLEVLGWEKPDKAGGVQTNATATLTLKKSGDGKVLKIINYASGKTSSDSYYTVIPGDKFKYFSDCAYTVQYDLKYDEAAAATNYICMITDFGGSFYNSFHLRNSGYGNNRYFYAGDWYDYEDSAYSSKSAGTDKTSSATIAYKLLGKYYDGTQLLSGISLSVRYVVEPQRGVSVYIRVNDEGYPASDKWVAVSAVRKGKVSSNLPVNDFGGGAIMLKVGADQNGSVDNIAVWLGTGDEPEDKSVQYLRDAKCHQYTEKDGTKICFLCGKSERDIAGNYWQLSIAPEYEGGELSNNAYYAGSSALDKDHKLENDSKMQIITETDAATFEAYLKKLDGKKDLAREFYREDAENIYAAYRFTDGENKGKRIYTYFFAAEKAVRVIEEYAASVSLDEFGYVYNKKEGDTTQFYQYGLSKDEEQGMLYIVKCADNSVIIIDGGTYKHFDNKESENLIQILREITGVASPEKVRISAWIITHGHQDHLSGMALFLKYMGKQVVLERMAYNFPSVYSSDGVLVSVKNETKKMFNHIPVSTPIKDIAFYNFHTGEQLRIADVEIDVLYTHEDLVDLKTGKTLIAGDFNNSSSVFNLRIDGYNIMITGDINQPAETVLLRNQKPAVKEASAVQTAHHLLNDVKKMYAAIAPEVVFVSAPSTRVARANLQQIVTVLKKTAGENFFCQCDATTGFEVRDGKLVKVYEKKALGTVYKNWTW